MFLKIDFQFTERYTLAIRYILNMKQSGHTIPPEYSLHTKTQLMSIKSGQRLRMGHIRETITTPSVVLVQAPLSACNTVCILHAMVRNIHVIYLWLVGHNW